MNDFRMKMRKNTNKKNASNQFVMIKQGVLIYV